MGVGRKRKRARKREKKKEKDMHLLIIRSLSPFLPFSFPFLFLPLFFSDKKLQQFIQTYMTTRFPKEEKLPGFLFPSFLSLFSFFSLLLSPFSLSFPFFSLLFPLSFHCENPSLVSPSSFLSSSYFFLPPPLQMGSRCTRFTKNLCHI